MLQLTRIIQFLAQARAFPDTLQAALATQRKQIEAMMATLGERWSAGLCVALDELAQPLAALDQVLPAGAKRRNRAR